MEFSPDSTTLCLLRDGEPIAVVVYSNYNGWDIEASIYTTSPDWKQDWFIRAGFEYPFEQLGCERITVRVDTDNIKSWKRAEKFGFVREGRLRKYRNGKDVFILGLLRAEYEHIKAESAQSA